MVGGTFNAPDSESYIVIGNGTADNNRKNAFTVNKRGTPTKPTDAITKGYLENQKFATKDNLDRAIADTDTALRDALVDGDIQVFSAYKAIYDDKNNNIANTYATKNALSQVDKLATAVQAYVDDDLTPRVEALEQSGGAVDVVTQAEFNTFVADLQDDGGDFYVGLAQYANFASRASTDSKGNEIDTTYATKTEMSNAIASAITTALNTAV